MWLRRLVICFFKQKTSYEMRISDWSSDVCSSDLCRACAHYIHPPVRFCPACESRDTVPIAVSGLATIHSFTVNHKAWLPGLAVPYVLALVELSEQAGLYLPTNIIGCDPETVRIGMRSEARRVGKECDHTVSTRW